MSDLVKFQLTQLKQPLYIGAMKYEQGTSVKFLVDLDHRKWRKVHDGFICRLPREIIPSFLVFIDNDDKVIKTNAFVFKRSLSEEESDYDGGCSS